MLGDSITERGLWNQLIGKSNIFNEGIAGNTTQDVLNRINFIDLDSKQVFLMIGINDILSGYGLDYIYLNYKEIIQILQDKNCKIILQSTLYVGKELPSELNKIVKELNIKLERYAKENNIIYLDINAILAPESYLENRFSLDGVHLNEDAYKEWSKLLKNYL